MKTKIFMLIAATVFVMINVQGRAQEKFSLGYKMEKGKVYKFAQENIIETIQEMEGQEMKMNTDGHTMIKYEVEDVSREGTITLVYSYDEVKLHLKGIGKDTTMEMKKMLDKKTRAEITKNGKVIQESSVDTTKGLKSMMSLNLFASSNLPRLPEQAIGIGDKWSGVTNDTSQSDDGLVVYKRNIEYTLAGTDKKSNHDCLKIDFKGNLEMTEKMKQMGMDVAREGSGETSGSLWFDPASGLLIEEQTVTAIEMTMAITGQSQITIPMSQKTTTTQKLVE